MTSIAYAMGQGASGASGAGGGITAFIPVIIMFVIFYFLLIRPQQKKTKEHQEMLNKLKKDDRVITSGGIYGRVTSLDENKVTLEVSDKVRIKILRSNISALDQPTPAAQTSKKK